jgi:hypothetical protein
MAMTRRIRARRRGRRRRRGWRLSRRFRWLLRGGGGAKRAFRSCDNHLANLSASIQMRSNST